MVCRSHSALSFKKTQHNLAFNLPGHKPFSLEASTLHVWPGTAITATAAIKDPLRRDATARCLFARLWWHVRILDSTKICIEYQMDNTRFRTY